MTTNTSSSTNYLLILTGCQYGSVIWTYLTFSNDIPSAPEAVIMITLTISPL